MNCLIAYYTRTGNTEKVAKSIAEEFNADLEKIIDKKKRTGIIGWIRAGYDAVRGNLTEIETIEKEPNMYDLIILGTPIWAGNPTPAIKTYILDNKEEFKKIALFSTSKGDNFQDTLDEMETYSDQESVAKQGFIEEKIKDDQIDENLNEFSSKIKEKTQPEH
jgi:flavodoxin